MKKALVTLAVGKSYERMFNKLCRNLWAEYAKKHEFDIVLLTKPLDDSERAQHRSPAWQKCLILSEPEVQKYDQAVWVDSDILINPLSPDITSNVPIERVGAVDAYAIPSKDEYRSMIERLYKFWANKGDKYIDNLTPTDFHNNFGLQGKFDSVVQTGCMVLSPHHHKELLEHVYYSYEDKGSSAWNYEMRPLSYEILTHHYEHWLTPKFNMIWPLIKQFSYPFLSNQYSLKEKIQENLGINSRKALIKKCVTTAFLNNYFLHFAGGTISDMNYLDKSIKSIFEI